ncbi:zinc-ribbon domain-containing protein [Halococcoides cellulosivorans]|uniref:Zinc-ribbon domain-containing protein n=1 Tax=Halococcoides cellulosivorans TaxID=1679096 RepID=A0A2R4X3M9_9EURY|nr:zinc-ribbon domain-containing protein [Halococcoides cellulosivorans]AWB28405.1 hypothetical protein HARCEL1_12185 [Halococcoides cellulosivorans]
MGLVSSLRRTVDGGLSTVWECRNCGETLSEDAAECPRCGAEDVARYEI